MNQTDHNVKSSRKIGLKKDRSIKKPSLAPKLMTERQAEELIYSDKAFFGLVSSSQGQKKIRDCLRCRTSFLSRGFSNRLCGGCVKWSASQGVRSCDVLLQEKRTSSSHID